MAKTNEKAMEEKINELNDVRKLATIARIVNTEPIEGADNIEKVFVRGWQCVAKKGEFRVGDLCVYVEVDSIMPDGLPETLKEAWKVLNKQMSKAETEDERDFLRGEMAAIVKENTRPEFEFLRGIKFHIKTRRILGEISQGICFPLSILKNNEYTEFRTINSGDLYLCSRDESEKLKRGILLVSDLDVTEMLGVTQYIAPDPATMGGNAAGLLTGVGLLISDEERVENLSGKYEQMKQFCYYKTEKLEGTSFTAYIKDGKFGVCGRTIDFQIPDEEDAYDSMNVYWKVAKKFDMEAKLREFLLNFPPMSLAIQGELIGEGIQKNIYKLKGQKVMFYNAFDIDGQKYWSYDAFVDLITKSLGLETVPILDQYYKLPETAKELLEEADRTYSLLNPAQLIEGFVLIANESYLPPTVRITRANFNRLSFKAKSRTYDLNKNK